MDGFSLCGPLTGLESTHKNKCHVLPVNSTNFHCYYLINVSASCFCEMLSAKQEFFTFFWSSHKASILTRRHGSFPLKSHMPHISLFEPLNHKSLLAFQIEGWINFVQMDWGRGLSALCTRSLTSLLYKEWFDPVCAQRQESRPCAITACGTSKLCVRQVGTHALYMFLV